ncbi:MAG: hypothetical protein PUC26_04165 [Eubacteriales bacterium]|jgi:hypothetical protein|nr:hypothetical protein [Eubacteriales bacterium]
MRKGRYTFKLKKEMTTDELFAVMQDHWHARRFNKPRKGMLWKDDYEEFIILPATWQHVIIIYTNKKKVIMNSAWPKTNIAEQLAETIKPSSEFYPILKASKGLPAGRDRMGPMKDALQRYAAEMARMLGDCDLAE